MEFLQLRYFYESAKNESFALTAKKHMVPTSSVSASVKRLENELGTKLFDRSSNRITLNEKGFVFFGMVEDIFSTVTIGNVNTEAMNCVNNIVVADRVAEVVYDNGVVITLDYNVSTITVNDGTSEYTVDLENNSVTTNSGELTFTEFVAA